MRRNTREQMAGDRINKGLGKSIAVPGAEYVKRSAGRSGLPDSTLGQPQLALRASAVALQRG